MSDEDVWRMAHGFRDAFSRLLVEMIRGDSDFIEQASGSVLWYFVQIIKMTDHLDVENEARFLMKMILTFTSLLASHNKHEAVELLSTIMGKFSTLIRITGEKCHK